MHRRVGQWLHRHWIHPVSSHVNFPRLLFLSFSHLSVAHPSGHGLNVSSLIPQEWKGHYSGGEGCLFCHNTHITELWALSPLRDWKVFIVRDCFVFYSKVVSPVLSVFCNTWLLWCKMTCTKVQGRDMISAYSGSLTGLQTVCSHTLLFCFTKKQLMQTNMPTRASHEGR